MYAYEGLGVKVVREKAPDAKADPIKDAEDAVEVVRRSIGNEDREVFIAIILDAKNGTLGINTISIGSLDTSLCHPRESFKAAVVLGAGGIIFAHNHPSGDLSPSEADIKVGKQMKEAGKILGIRVLDFLILNAYEYKSLVGDRLI